MDIEAIRKTIREQNIIEFMRQPLKNFRETLLFIHPRLDEVRLSVSHPPEQYGDLSTNALRFLHLNYGTFTYTQEEFIKMVDMFVPNKKIEVVNGMLNVYFSPEQLFLAAKYLTP